MKFPVGCVCEVWDFLPKRTVESKSTKPVWWSNSRISPKGKYPERISAGRMAGEIRRWSILCCFLLVVSPVFRVDICIRPGGRSLAEER